MIYETLLDEFMRRLYSYMGRIVDSAYVAFFLFVVRDIRENFEFYRLEQGALLI